MSKDVQAKFARASMPDIIVTPEEDEAFAALEAKSPGKNEQPASDAASEPGMTFEEYQMAVRQIQKRSSVSKPYNPDF